MRSSTLLCALVLGLLASGLASANEVVAIKAAKIVTMDDKDTVFNDAVLIMKGNKILALGEAATTKIPAGARVVDLGERWLVPGFVDCHDHIAGSLRDLNDGVYLTNPGLRTVDTLDPENENLKNAVAGGVTTVLLIPGSGNNMSGFGTISRTAGRTVADMTVRATGSLKIAQAGNPERYWFGVGRSYMNYNLRQTLTKAKNYHEAHTRHEAAVKAGKARGAGPAKNLVWEGFRGLFRKEFPASVHTQMYQVLAKTIRMLHDSFGIKVVLDHSTFDAYKNAPQIVEKQIDTIVGPRQYFFDRTERRIVGCAQMYYQQGVRKLGINTDAPVVLQEELTLQATIGCRLGLDRYVALKGLTIVPARALGLGDRIGSLEVGKEADFGAWSGDPIDPRSTCHKTWVQGRKVYDSSKKRRF
ncbi:MAG: amidohydrolase family protein [Planctomycetes bacterium]|nr:amidohydrolase family protein [Planctomycetota bacterium]